MISMISGVLAAEGDAMEFTDVSGFDDGASTTTASGAGGALGTEAKSIGEGIAAFFKALFGGVEGGVGSSEWLSIFFFALLLGMFVYTALESFFGLNNKFIVWGATIGATGLAIIMIPTEYLTALRTSYGAMGLTILAVIPFIIILAFTIKVKNKGIARGTWIVFALYYFWLYVGDLVNASRDSKLPTLPYFLAMLVGVAMFFMIGWVRLWMFKGEMESHMERVKKGLAKKKVNREDTTEHEEQTAEDIAAAADV